MTKTNDKAQKRVFAVQSTGPEGVNLYGFGVMENAVHPTLGRLNPRITLDNDRGVIWGVECWWGAESRWESEFLQGREFKLVDPPGRRGELE